MRKQPLGVIEIYIVGVLSGIPYANKSKLVGELYRIHNFRTNEYQVRLAIKRLERAALVERVFPFRQNCFEQATYSLTSKGMQSHAKE